MYFKVLTGCARWQAAATGGLPPNPIKGGRRPMGGRSMSAVPAMGRYAGEQVSYGIPEVQYR